MLALDERGDATTDQVLTWSRGRGADAVLVCAAGRSSDAVMRVPALCRDRAAVVIVGDVGLQLSRTPFYERELSLRFARSYGPGRYEPSYEAWGVDYPGRAGALDRGPELRGGARPAGRGRLAVSDLVTHTFDIAEAAAAYRLIEERAEPYLAIRLAYPDDGSPTDGVRLTVVLRPPARRPVSGWIGAGAFSTGTLLPAFRAAGFDRFVAIASASGLSARRAAERHGFEKAVSGADAVIGDPDVEVVVIATPHDTHADLTVRALAAGRHVWCEKPLALTLDELDAVEKAWRESGRQLAVGFNRRWSPAVLAAQQALAGVAAPKLVVYRVAAGRVPDGHWYHDRRQGGRLLGEVCHFVDTAQALVGAPIEDVTALPGGGGRGRSPATTWWCRYVSRTARWPRSPTAAPTRWPARSGSRSRPGRTGWSSTTSAPPRRTARRSGRAARTRAIARARPRSGSRCRRGGHADRGHAGHDARHDPGRRGTGRP